MKKQEQQCNSQYKILTIPNLLSLIRLCMIPLFIWLYCVKERYVLTGFILILSGITDIADGFVARHFHMISDFGKIFDPIVDKLTQAAMLFCLITRFPLMITPLILMLFKEFYMGITGALVIKKTGQVFGAEWHGKVATCMLYGMMILHVVWYDIPSALSIVTIVACVCMMLISMILYGIRNRNALKRM